MNRLAATRDRQLEYSRHKDSYLARAARHRTEKRAKRCVPPDELKLYQLDSLREKRLGITKFVVCREDGCGFMGARLDVGHIHKLHKLSVEEYSRKHHFPPLVADAYRVSASEDKKQWQEEDPKHHQFFHTKDGVNKRRRLIPGEGPATLKGKPATPAMRRHLMELAEQRAGTSRNDRRGKRLLGKDRQHAKWVDVPAVDDAAIVELKFERKLEREIARAVDRTPGAVAARVTRIGLPARNCVFFRGEPFCPRHIVEFARDCGLSLREACSLLNLKYFYMLNRVRARHKESPFSAALGAPLLGRVRALIAATCWRNVGGKRVREFLGSEVLSIRRDLPMLQLALSELRVAHQSGQITDQPAAILHWLCERCRGEVAQEVSGKTSQATFRRLLFFWPSFKILSFRRGRSLGEFASELLAVEYGVAAGRIRDAGTRLTSVDPRTMGMVIRATRQPASGLKPAHRPRSKDREAMRAQTLRRKNPHFSWSQTALKVDPAGFAKDPKGTTDRIRLAVTYRKKTSKQ